MGRLGELDEDDIASTGYVVHTLEAALWCLLRADGYRDAVLRALNLGGDTDTTACVAGGLAGLAHGLSAVPRSWRQQVVRREDVGQLLLAFTALL